MFGSWAKSPETALARKNTIPDRVATSQRALSRSLVVQDEPSWVLLVRSSVPDVSASICTLCGGKSCIDKTC